LFGQHVDALEHVVDIGPSAGPPDLGLQRLDGRACGFVRILQPALYLPAKVGRDAPFSLLERAASGADCSIDKAG
jgi:hypothetical protein